tara:strand:- start:3498 stop:3677 length:180 start_codon:yes stop_codon:yes gene_type:complete
MLALKLGISLNNIKAGGGGGGDPISTMITDFTNRVSTDGGSTEAEACLTDILTFINNIE